MASGLFASLVEERMLRPSLLLLVCACMVIIICFVRFVTLRNRCGGTPKQLLLSLDAPQTQNTSYCNLPTGTTAIPVIRYS